MNIINRFRKKFMTNPILYHIKRSIDERRALVRNMGSIIRQYMSQNVAKNYTTVKKVAGKKVFKETEFYNCLEAAVSNKFKKKENPLSKRQFKEAIQAIFNNVKDWNGKRAEHRDRTKNTEELSE
ncbi:uncharacterized protein LOC105257926 [Camponotus floridanus]|uniref:uncharacterized protein LOC105257926 n=1 Tax=Camponotus floridanus TaxID=104421 RepID=UPI000DC69159|nr:uncharacterized protein LOC105257926 [Camponotus floridanus]